MAHQGTFSTEIETLTHVLRLVQAFRAFDGNYDGLINAAKLGGIMGSLGYKGIEQEIGAMMQNGDKNKDGTLSIEEFLDLNTQYLVLGGQATSLGTALLEVSNMVEEESVNEEEFYTILENIGLDLSLGDFHNLISSLDFD